MVAVALIWICSFSGNCRPAQAGVCRSSGRADGREAGAVRLPPPTLARYTRRASCEETAHSLEDHLVNAAVHDPPGPDVGLGSEGHRDDEIQGVRVERLADVGRR